MDGATNTTIEELRARLAGIQQNLRQIDLMLRGLAGQAEPAQEFRQARTDSIFADVLAAAAEECGMDLPEPIGIERLHALMLREGVKPEANLLSSGIIEMRDE